MVVAAVAMVLIAARLIYVQGVAGPALAERALDERMRTEVQAAHRGDITDASGDVVLATSVDRYTIAADQLAIENFVPDSRHEIDGEVVEGKGAVAVARLLAPVLGRDAPELAAELVPAVGTDPDRNHVLAKDVVPEVQRAILDLSLSAYVSTTLESERVYPAKTTAGNILGFLGDEDGVQVGRGGAELMFDDVLSGTSGYVTYDSARGGQQIPGASEERVEPVPGDDVRTTLDLDVQWKAQDELEKAVQDSGAEYGMAVVQDVRTGDVVALADSGTPDPNDRSSAAVANSSRVVSNIFDPGSTGKVITMAAILDLGIATPTSEYEVPYSYTTPNGQTFSDSHEHPVQKLTLAGILTTSSNTGTVIVGQEIPKQVRYDYLSKFGFGSSTGLGLPGESAGILRDPDDWDGSTEYAVLFGQGLAVNAMQITSVFSTIANGGVRMEPNLVEGTVDADDVFLATDRGEGTRVIDEETADTVLHMMEGVTSGEEGTGKKATIPGYRVAGKTGTAQVPGPNGELTGIMASFVGVAPADDPRYAVSVFLKDPSSSIFGGDVAAPAFRDIMAFALEQADVPPSETPYEPLPETW
ncbi:peptidoglycan synthetase FtsI [Paraoerskovia marina]|uniref:Peptidoglycan synthetase FtsI n=1 Tax=Paraoerskovia marina TaxID=545619 RepID=A0A1H1TR36_9CELL|nr:peptidoglycan synthetase FtsI [Paraoerskovia marina]